MAATAAEIFYMTDENNIYRVRKEGGKIEKHIVGNAPIECAARLKDIETGIYGLLFRWQDENGMTEYACWLSEAWSLKSEVYEELVGEAGGGFFKISDFRAFVHHCASLARAGEIPTLASTARAGWSKDYSYYVANGFSIGRNAPVYMSKRGARWERNGDEQAYLNKMRELLAANPAVAFVCGFFAAGALVKLVNAENFMISLVGRTSTGKTLAIKTALAMRGAPSDFATFDSTAGSLKSLLKQCNDSCMLIDEIGQSGLAAEQKQKLIYDFSQGKERGRLRRVGEDFAAKEPEKSHYTLIFTGEESISSSAHAGGAQVRVTELVFNEHKKLWESISSADEAEEFENFLHQNHGFLMPRVIEKIAQDISCAKQCYDSILRQLRQTAEAEGWIASSADSRKLKAMALGLAGATLIGEVLGIDLGIRSEVADFVVNEIMSSSLVVSDGEAFADFLRSFALHYEDRLEGIGDDTKKRNVVGTVVKKSGFLVLKIAADFFEGACAKGGIDAKRLLDWAADAGWLRYIMNGSGSAGGKRLFKKRMTISGVTGVKGYEFEIPTVPNEEDDF